MNRPWIKFYVADWRDARLRRCSLAARGLWIDLMTYMHEAEPYGHLLIAGEELPIGELALQLSRPVAEVKKAMAELEKNGVFSRADNGVIFSRRMVRDNLKEQQDRQNGKWGGNPKLKAKEKGGVNPPISSEDKAQWNMGSSSPPTSFELEEPQREQASRRKSKTQLPENFVPDRAFPKKMGWPEARIDLQVQAFCDYALAHAKQYANWQAAWRKWCTSSFQQRETVNGHEHSASAAAGRLAEKAERGEFKFAPRPSLLPEASPDDVRLLPKG